MSIKVFIKNKEYLLEETDDLTVNKVFKRFNLLPEGYLCVRNGELLTEKDLLRDGDILRFIPVISGGQQ